MIPESDWWELALCRGMDQHIWFASGPGKQALAICAQCPSVDPCLREALKCELHFGSGSTFGVRGGKTAPQRKRMLRELRKESRD